MSGDLRVHTVTWYISYCQAKQFLLYLLVKKRPEHGERDVKEKHLQHHLSLNNQSFLQRTRITQEEFVKKKKKKRDSCRLLFTAQQVKTHQVILTHVLNFVYCGYFCWFLLKSTRSACGCGKGCRLKVTLVSGRPVPLGMCTDGSMRFST